MDGGNGIFCLVVADHSDFLFLGEYQGDNLPWSLHKRLADADELDLADWVDHLDHSASLSVEDYPVTEIVIVAVHPAQDDYAVGVNLGEDWVPSWREA